MKRKIALACDLFSYSWVIFVVPFTIHSLLIPAWIIIGVIMNRSALYFNGGKMPVKIDCSFETESHKNLTPETRLKFLCDIFETQSRIFSAGDVVLISGTIVFFAKLIYIIIHKDMTFHL
jgi:Family of unknown function (DUF5317)